MEQQLNNQQRRAEQTRQLRNNKRIAEQVRQDDSSSGWDELRTLYGQMLIVCNTASALLPYINDHAMIRRMQDPTQFTKLMKVVANDTAEFKKRLDSIYSRHASRSGRTGNPDDLMACLEIGGQYDEWLDSYQQVVMPNIEQAKNMLEAAPGPDGAVSGDYIPASH